MVIKNMYDILVYDLIQITKPFEFEYTIKICSKEFFICFYKKKNKTNLFNLFDEKLFFSEI